MSGSTRPRQLSIVVDESSVVARMYQNSATLIGAMNLAEKLLSSHAFRVAFSSALVFFHLDVTPNFRLQTVMKGLNSALANTFTIDIINSLDSVAAYAVVYRLNHPHGLCLHPMLLNNAMIREEQLGRPCPKFVLFIAWKIMHEISHLIHYELVLSSFRGEKLTPAKEIKEKLQEFRTKKSQVNVREGAEITVCYDDFGTRVEKEMGGIFESRSLGTGLFMDVADIGCYQSVKGLCGIHVDAPETIRRIQKGETPVVAFVMGGEYKSKDEPFITSVGGLEGSFRNASTPDADVAGVRDSRRHSTNSVSSSAGEDQGKDARSELWRH